MTNRPIHLSDLSLYRGELMGVAMLMVILFHVSGARHETLWLCVSRCGNVGVDMFLFLSGIGLWFAWSKTTGSATTAGSADTPAAGKSAAGLSHSLLRFYIRRYLRVYPAWLIIACLYYIPRFYGGELSLADTLLSITINWGFWEHDELTFWFIPAIMMLYTVAPAYMELIRRVPTWRWMPVMAMTLCVLMQYWKPLHDAVGHLEIFFSRVPIFLLGINAGKWVMEKRALKASALWPLLLTFVMSGLACINFEDGLRGRFPLFLERMVYIPLTVSMLLLLCQAARLLPRQARRALTFIGGISLELYLIHAHFVLSNVREWQLGYWLTAIATIAISCVAAWLLHLLTGRCSRLDAKLLSAKRR